MKTDTRGRRAQPGEAKVARGDEGIALIIVLLFVVLLTVLVVEYAYETQVEASFAENFHAELHAYYAAKSGIALGQAVLSQDLVAPPETGTGGENFDCLLDAWAEGVPIRPINDAVVQCTISDEYGKIPLNALIRVANINANEPPPGGQQGQNPVPNNDGQTGEPVLQDTEVDPVLERALEILFEERGVEENPVPKIIDWIDQDDDETSGGAESSYYESLEVPYGCKNLPLDSVEELLLIPGITPEVFWGDPEQDQLPMTELLTVHGHPRGRVNINTAELEVLRAMGEANNQPDLEEYYEAVRGESPILSNDELRQKGLNPERPRAGQQVDPDAPTPRLVVSSAKFRIRGDGASGDISVRIEAFVERGGEAGGTGAFRILDWRVTR